MKIFQTNRHGKYIGRDHLYTVNITQCVACLWTICLIACVPWTICPIVMDDMPYCHGRYALFSWMICPILMDDMPYSHSRDGWIERETSLVYFSFQNDNEITNKTPRRT